MSLWQQLRFEFRSTIQVDSARFESISSGGEATCLSRRSSIMWKFAELRSMMYQPGKDAGFTATYTIDRSGELLPDGPLCSAEGRELATGGKELGAE